MKDVRPDVEQQKTVLADATPAEAKLAWITRSRTTRPRISYCPCCSTHICCWKTAKCAISSPAR
ncbi:hypothetical protein M8494_11185 [Serratia ureilytica]